MVWLRSVIILPIQAPTSVVIRPCSQGLYTKENTKTAKEEIFSKEYFPARITAVGVGGVILVYANLDHDHSCAYVRTSWGIERMSADFL